MVEVERYDALVIGAGQAGGPLASALARSGRRTAIVERVHVGGTCINEGCTPTKTMVASARAAYVTRRGADYGVRTGEIQIDMNRVRERKRAIVESFRTGSQRSIESTPRLELLLGEASFTAPHEIGVRTAEGGTRRMHADLIVINTGCRPSKPALPGVDEVETLDSTSIMELDQVPEHLLVMGGGYIGLEFGQMFRRFGSRVTIIHRGEHLLAREDDDVADAVADILREDGVGVLLRTQPTAVRREGDGMLLTVRGPDGERTLSGSHLLVATGRVPNVETLDLATAGIQHDAHGYIHVNERLETSMPGIYAVGDVKGGPAFTHISYDDFRILRTNLVRGGSATTAGRLVPYTVFIDPQLGRVGLSERDARAQGRAIRVARLPMSHVARALEVDETRGFMKAIVDAQSGEILGATMLGIEGGEIMAIFEVAMLGHLPYTALKDAIFAHPTLAEALNNLFMALDGE
jgi:pyruvate/2-oxoglutarate dehydrogenase complex dihydrolipoamide dehydrogenase (E3) component